MDEKERIVSSIERWMHSGFSDWRALVVVYAWSRQIERDAEDFSDWIAQGPTGHFVVSHFLNFISAIEHLTQANDLDGLRRHIAATMHDRYRPAGCSEYSGPSSHKMWYCCRVDLSILQAKCYLDRHIKHDAFFEEIASSTEASLGKVCAGCEAARNWANQHFVPLLRVPGVGLPSDLEAEVQVWIEQAVTQKCAIRFDGVELLRSGNRSAIERLWLLGKTIKVRGEGLWGRERALLVAERIWGVSLGVECQPDEEVFLGRCILDLSQLQPFVDSDCQAPTDMLRLLEKAEALGYPASSGTLALAHSRAAKGYGWQSDGDMNERDPIGLSHVANAAELGSSEMRLVFADAAHVYEPDLAAADALAFLQAEAKMASLGAMDRLASYYEAGTVFADGSTFPRSPLLAAPMRRAAFLEAESRALSGDRNAMIHVADDYRFCRWLPGDAGFCGPDLDLDHLTSWRKDIIEKGALHACLWLFRVIGIEYKSPEKLKIEDIPASLDSISIDALVRLAHFFEAGFGVKFDPKLSMQLLERASDAGSNEAATQLLWKKWKAWPGTISKDTTSEEWVAIKEELEHIQGGFHNLRNESSRSAVLAWHLSGFAKQHLTADYFIPLLNDAFHFAYSNGPSGFVRRLRPMVLALSGDTTRIDDVIAAWQSYSASVGGRISIGFNKLFSKERLGDLLAYNPVLDGLLSTRESGDDPVVRFLNVPLEVHNWLDSHDTISTAAADWLGLRAQVSQVLYEPNAASWARASARAQLRAPQFPREEMTFGARFQVKELESQIDWATTDSGPIFLRLDKDGCPIPFSRSAHQRPSRWERLSVGFSGVALNLVKVFRLPNWIQLLLKSPNRGLCLPGALSTPCFKAVKCVRVFDDRANRAPLIEVEGERDDKYGFISLEDIWVALALAFQHTGDASLSLEPLANDLERPWRFRRRVFTPNWIGATDFGRTFYITDYWLMPFEGSQFSYTKANHTAGIGRRFVQCEPWVAASAVGGAAPYANGMVQLRLAGRIDNGISQAAATSFPFEAHLPEVIAEVYGAGVDKNADGTDQRNLDDTWLGNFFVRGPMLLSSHYAKMSKAYPVFHRVAILQALYNEFSRLTEKLELQETTRLHRELTARSQEWQAQWDSRSTFGSDDIVWSDGRA